MSKPLPQFAKTGSRSQTIPGTRTPEVDRYAALREKRDEVQAEMEEAEQAVVAQARQAWLAFNRNQAEPLSTVSLGPCKVTFSAQYKSADVLPDPLKTQHLEFVLNDGAVEDEAWYTAFRKLRTDFPGAQAEIALDIDNVEDKAGFQIRLGALRDKFPGLAITMTQKTVPVPNFAVLRHRELTPKQNLLLEEQGLGTKVAVKKA